MPQAPPSRPAPLTELSEEEANRRWPRRMTPSPIESVSSDEPPDSVDRMVSEISIAEGQLGINSGLIQMHYDLRRRLDHCNRVWARNYNLVKMQTDALIERYAMLEERLERMEQHWARTMHTAHLQQQTQATLDNLMQALNYPLLRVPEMMHGRLENEYVHEMEQAALRNMLPTD